MDNHSQSTEINIESILEQATSIQIDWVLARIVMDSDAKAAKAANVRRETVCRWPNKKDLDKAVHYYKKNRIPAVHAVIQNAAMEAAQVMVSELKGKQKLKASTEILDRAGVARLTKIAPVTPDGKEPYDSDTNGQRLALLRQLVATEQTDNSGPDTDE